MSTIMETYSGRLVDLANPDPSQICVEDIAWHLSHLGRFGGATRDEKTYSVGQHSVLVFNRIRQTMPNPSRVVRLTSLLHDAHEAYMGDKIRPMCELLDLRVPLQRLKTRLQRAIYWSLLGEDFEPYEGPEIKEADDWALRYEAYHLMHSKGRDFQAEAVLDDEHILRNVMVWDSAKAFRSFKNHYLLALAEDA